MNRSRINKARKSDDGESIQSPEVFRRSSRSSERRLFQSISLLTSLKKVWTMLGSAFSSAGMTKRDARCMAPRLCTNSEAFASGKTCSAKPVWPTSLNHCVVGASTTSLACGACWRDWIMFLGPAEAGTPRLPHAPQTWPALPNTSFHSYRVPRHRGKARVRDGLAFKTAVAGIGDSLPRNPLRTL